jgi:hypothetical protein
MTIFEVVRYGLFLCCIIMFLYSFISINLFHDLEANNTIIIRRGNNGSVYFTIFMLFCFIQKYYITYEENVARSYYLEHHIPLICLDGHETTLIENIKSIFIKSKEEECQRYYEELTKSILPNPLLVLHNLLISDLCLHPLKELGETISDLIHILLDKQQILIQFSIMIISGYAFIEITKTIIQTYYLKKNQNSRTELDKKIV